MKNILYTLFLGSVLFVSCSKNNDTTPVNDKVKAPVIIEFDNVMGPDRDLHLGETNAANVNSFGEQITVNNLKYFISNISLLTTDGDEYVVPQDSSYFLIDEAMEETHEARINIPEGDYKTLKFTLGVDSLRSTMDIGKRTGVLDPSSGHDGMYWGWNPGYIFFKMEGTSPAAPLDTKGERTFRYHIGGFGGYSAPTINNIKTVTLDLSQVGASGIVRARTGRTPQVHLFADVLKMFNGSTNISIAVNPQVMFSDFSLNVSNNYSGMFSHNHTHN